MYSFGATLYVYVFVDIHRVADRRTQSWFIALNSVELLPAARSALNLYNVWMYYSCSIDVQVLFCAVLSAYTLVVFSSHN